MAFQVREFEFQAGEGEFVWSFKLANINSSQLDFYSQQASSRSLLHLTQDLSSQVEQSLQKRNKRAEGRERVVRKLCEKMLKQLRVNLQSFAADIGQQGETVRRYFGKGLEEAGATQRVSEKCKLWIVSSWSYIQDGKRTNPDFQVLNQLYAVTLGDNFNELADTGKTHSESLVLIDININVEDRYISQNFLWDSQDISNIRIRSFASHFLKDTLAEHSIQLDKQAFLQLEKDTKIQIRTQILYKTLLKKYAGILLNFSSMDIPTEVKEYTIPISLKLLQENGSSLFEDEFEWDILNDSNSVQQFVGGLVDDYELPSKYRSQICYKIRTQINSELQRKFDLLVKTFKSIHRDRESPKLNTQTISVLRKNVTFAMDVSLPCTDIKYTPNANFYFNNSDLFSLLSRNLDILPEEFQEILMCKEGKNNEKQGKNTSKWQSGELLKKNGLSIESNPYLSTVGNNYNVHNIWRKALGK